MLPPGWSGCPPSRPTRSADFRAFNYERIYLRTESVAQGAAVIEVPRFLVQHLIAHPEQIPGFSPERDDDPRSIATAAVAYAATMTDRYAFGLAVSDAGWPRERLPVGTGRRCDGGRLRRACGYPAEAFG